MNEFVHIRTILGMILSLSLAQLLKGISKLIVHPARARPYLVHLLWVSYLFLYIIFYWWEEYQLSKLTSWTFLLYSLMIVYVVLCYLLCSLVFPEDISDYKDFKAYYFARRPWFFSTLAFTFLIDLADSYAKGADHFKNLGVEYPLLTALHIVLCMLAIKWPNERYHALLAIFLLGDIINWTLRYYLIA